MIKIAIFNRKGGVGKTITSVNLAGCLDVAFKKDVLVIDCDAQGNMTTCFTVNHELTIDKTISQIYEEYPELVRHKVKLLSRNNKELVETRITLIPADSNLDMVESTDMYALKKYLMPLENQYDFCIMDCPPDLSETAINALCAADYLIIPSFSGRDSVNGYGMVMEEIELLAHNGFNVNLNVLGVFLNAVDKRRSVEKYYVEMWKDELKDKVLDSQVRDSSDIVNAYEFGKPVHYFKPHSPAAKDYEMLCKEIIKKIKK